MIKNYRLHYVVMDNLDQNQLHYFPATTSDYVLLTNSILQTETFGYTTESFPEKLISGT